MEMNEGSGAAGSCASETASLSCGVGGGFATMVVVDCDEQGHGFCDDVISGIWVRI